MKCQNYVPAHANSGIFTFLIVVTLTVKILFFLLKCEGKIKILRGYCGGKSPNWYIGPWALLEDMDTSEEE